MMFSRVWVGSLCVAKEESGECTMATWWEIPSEGQEATVHMLTRDNVYSFAWHSPIDAIEEEGGFLVDVQGHILWPQHGLWVEGGKASTYSEVYDMAKVDLAPAFAEDADDTFPESELEGEVRCREAEALEYMREHAAEHMLMGDSGQVLAGVMSNDQGRGGWNFLDAHGVLERIVYTGKFILYDPRTEEFTLKDMDYKDVHTLVRDTAMRNGMQMMPPMDELD